jgi:hypothetical protein
MPESIGPGWWATHRLSSEYQRYVAHEAEAVRVVAYMPALVPGLLQTPRYALAATATVLGRPEDDSDVVARARVRAERQRALADRLASGRPIRLVAILDDVVLRRPFGDPVVMREQLDHLADQAEREHVALVIMPTAEGGHAGLDGKFELAEFDDADPVVFLEAAVHDYLERDPGVTGRYREIADRLVSSGIGGADAIALVRAVRDEIGR